MNTIHVTFDDTRIKELIQNGEVVAFPTETVYGLGVIYNNEEAFNKLVESKKRNPDKPFTLMLGRTSDISKYVVTNTKIDKIINKFMPGEITILVKPKDNLYPWVTLGSKYIGIRVPDSSSVCEMINDVGEPMLVTSANMSGCPVCKDYKEVCEQFDGHISLIVNGLTRSSNPSTIVILDDNITLVREGNLSFEDIKKVWEE